MNRLMSGLVVAGLVLFSSGTAFGQCISMFRGGGLPDNFGDTARVVDHLVVFDDGSGPTLYGIGIFKGTNTYDYYLARWTGTQWSAPVARFNAAVSSVVVHDGELYVSGGFAQINGQPFVRIAHWNGSRWAAAGSGFDSGALDMATYNGELYAAGAMEKAGGEFVSGLAKWDGTQWAAVGGSSAGNRRKHAMAYDSLRQRVVVAGEIPETSEWDGTRWRIADAAGLPVRDYPAMAFDSARGVTVLFGGQNNSGPVGETWEWNGAVWQQRAITGPSPRYGCAMAYDSARGKIVLNGGRDDQWNTSGFRETWEYDGAGWTLVSSAGPDMRSGHAMSYDSARGVTVLYGGSQNGSSFPQYTWEWNGLTWTRSSSTFGPSFVQYASMAYDSLRQVTVLFGGRTPTNDIWEWNGTAWTQRNLPTSPTTRMQHATAYDQARGRLVVYGGDQGSGVNRNDTWTFDGTTWVRTVEGFSGGAAQTLAVYDDGGGAALFAGGVFNRAGGLTVSKIARYRSGAWSNLGGGTQGGFNGWVNDMVVYGGALHVGGDFTSMSGVACNNLAKWTGSWAAVNMGQTSRIDTLGVFTRPNKSYLISGPTFRMWDGTSPVTVSGGPTATIKRMAQFTYNNLPAVWMTAGSSWNGLWVLGDTCVGPAISVQPTAVVGIVGQEARFTVTATGTPTLRYQWRKNGVPLSDNGVRIGTAAATLRLASWSINDIGDYDCVVSNDVGSVTSDAAHFGFEYVNPAGDPASRAIVWSLAAVPDRAGRQYDVVYDSELSDAGVIAFTSRIGGELAMNRWAAGTGSTIIVGNEFLPGLSGARMTSLGNYSIGDADQIYFEPQVTDSRGTSAGIWTYQSGSLQKVASWGDPVPGTGGTYGRFTQHPRAGSGGMASFWTQVVNGPTSRDAIVNWNSGSGASVAAIVGGEAAGTGSTFIGFSQNNDGIAPNANGEVLLPGAMVARRSVVRGSTDYDNGAWIAGPDGLSPLLVRGNAAPGFPAGSLLDYTSYPVFNARGDAMCQAFVAQPNSAYGTALYRFSHGVPTLAFAKGDQIAPGEAIQQIRTLAMNDRGDAVVIFTTTRPTGECCQRSLWLLPRGGAPVLVMRDGVQSVVGMPSGLNTYSIQEVASINDLGMLAFNVSVTGVGGSGNGVLGWTAAHGVFPLLAPSSQFETGTGVFRTVVNAKLTPTFNSYSCTDLNRSGQMTLLLQTLEGVNAISFGQFQDHVASWYPCAAIIRQPDDVVVREGTTAAAAAFITGSNARTYAWYRDGAPLSEGGRLSGTGTQRLRIADALPSDSGVYQLVVTDSCGTIESREVVITVTCLGDFNQDGFIDGFDYDDFVACFEGVACPQGQNADINNDGFVDGFDYDDFVAAFELGC